MKKYLPVILVIISILLSGCEPEVESRESSIWERRQVNFSRIIENNTPVRSGLGEDFEIVRELEEGQEVDVVAEIGNWYVVQLDDNQLGSVEEEKAQPVVKEESEDQEQQIDDTQEGTMEEAEEDIDPIDNSTEEENMVEIINKAR